MLTVNAVLTYFDVNLTAKVLGRVPGDRDRHAGARRAGGAGQGRRPQGFAVAETINPIGAFSPAAGIAGASAGLGLFFAFWSWVGFESTAMYGEESRNPKKIIPRATMLSVLGVGAFYVFVSWMAIAGTGPQQAVELAQDSATSSEIFFGPVRSTYGEWAITVFNILLVTRIVRLRHGVPQLCVALPAAFMSSPCQRRCSSGRGTRSARPRLLGSGGPASSRPSGTGRCCPSRRTSVRAVPVPRSLRSSPPA